MKRLFYGASALIVTSDPLLAAGVADTAVSQAVDDLGATWTLIKAGAVGILVFLMAVALLKKGYRKAS